MSKIKRKVIIVTAIVLAFIAVVLAIALPIIYTNGMLPTVHPLKSAKDGQIRVACVGDSITYGHGIWQFQKYNYPSVLQRLLGDGYCVNNYGYSAKCLLKDANQPYTKTTLYDKSLGFAPDIVIIMLGSNDTKHFNWKGADAFKSEYIDFINSYLLLGSHPDVYLIAPPGVWCKNGDDVMYHISNSVIKDELDPAIREVAQQLGVNFIDMYGAFENRPNLFSDGVHPNRQGADLLAHIVYDNLRLQRSA